MDVLKLLAAVTLAACATPAAAHVTAERGEAPAGAYQAVRFRVGHACNDTVATTAVRIEIPAGMPSVRAQPKPGWTLSLDRDPREPARVVAVTWRGELPPDQYDEFGLFFRLPAELGVLYFPTVQTCGAVEQRWIETAPAGAPRPKFPAPQLRLLPPATPPQGGHQHH